MAPMQESTAVDWFLCLQLSQLGLGIMDSFLSQCIRRKGSTACDQLAPARHGSTVSQEQPALLASGVAGFKTAGTCFWVYWKLADRELKPGVRGQVRRSNKARKHIVYRLHEP